MYSFIYDSLPTKYLIFRNHLQVKYNRYICITDVKCFTRIELLVVEFLTFRRLTPLICWRVIDR